MSTGNAGEWPAKASAQLGERSRGLWFAFGTASFPFAMACSRNAGLAGVRLVGGRWNR